LLEHLDPQAFSRLAGQEATSTASRLSTKSEKPSTFFWTILPMRGFRYWISQTFSPTANVSFGSS
jgi:hypothetical protein